MEEYRSGHNGPHSKCGSPKGLVGSNPTSSAIKRDVAQFGRAPRSGRGGRWFKSSHPDHIKAIVKTVAFFVRIFSKCLNFVSKNDIIIYMQ